MTKTILNRLHAHAQTRPTAPAYCEKRDNEWVATSWSDYCDTVHHVGRALMALGIESNDTVGILGSNRPEWSIFALGAMAAGGVPVGIYTTSPVEDVQYLINHAEPTVVLVENAAEWEKVRHIRESLPMLRHVVCMRDADVPDDSMVMSWDAFLSRRDTVSERALSERMAALEPEHLASLIYTAGTTGNSKGVMLTHANLVHTVRIFNQVVGVGPEDRYLSYLPLAHAAEQMFVVYGATYVGNTVYYNPSLMRLAQHLQEVQPTVFFGVPRVWEQFRRRIERRLDEQTGLRRTVLEWARTVGREATKVRNQGEELAGLLRLKYLLAEKVVFSKIKPELGLSEAHYCAVGAAPTRKETLEFFAGLDVIICEGYSQSEGCGATTANYPGHTKFGTVGPPLPEVDVRIADDGEILIRGPNIFRGYYKNPDATEAALVDGWLHSGDLGEFDSDGFLVLTGRKKEIIVTSNGENIAPQKVENVLKQNNLIDEAVVVGDGRRHLTALLVLDDDAIKRFARQHNIDMETNALHEQQDVLDVVDAGVERANQRLASHEQVRDFRILPRDLSIDEGELTPTLKVRRHVVEEHFAYLIEEMY